MKTLVEMELKAIIKNRIRKEGLISFRDYMEMCLYYPELGYYTSSREKIGKNGDYFTSPTFSPVFGELIAKQLEEMWNSLHQNPFTIVEYGAGTGALCEAILGYLKQNKKLYQKLRYCIIEKSAELIKLQRSCLNEKVSWHTSICDIEDIHGCVLSNELVDNFAVHRVVKNEELMEIFIDENFNEILKPACCDLKNYFAELKVELKNGFQTEINLQAIDWMREIAANLKRGYVLTIDYGYPSHELYADHRKEGTLMCYNKHQTNGKLYSDIGMQDITAHVNFSALCLWGYKNGLQFSGFTNQARFLDSLGFSSHLKSKEIPGQDYLNFKKEMHLTRTLLKDMGDKFKVLIQHKNTANTKLMGLSSLAT